MDDRPLVSASELLRQARTESERIAAGVAAIACPDCEPALYLTLLERALYQAGRHRHDVVVSVRNGVPL